MPSRASSPTKREHLGDELRVERARDLVEEHDARLHRERAHDRDALLLAAREPVGIVVALVPHTDAVEQRVGAVDVASDFDSPSTFVGASVTLWSTLMCGNRL